MSNALQITNKIEAALMEGDLSKLSDTERLQYFQKVCESVGVNPLTRPFEYLRLNGKLVLYARKDATDQLRKIHSVSVTKLETQMVGDICVVTATGRDKTGKEDSEVGAVDVKGLTGEKLANAMMKASTKAKRRLTLSICGLGLLDESEVESIPDARPEPLKAAGNVVNLPSAQLEQHAAEQPQAPYRGMSPLVNGAPTNPGAYVITFGKKYLNKRLDSIPMPDLDEWADYLVEGARKKGKELDGIGKEAVDAVDTYLRSRDYGKN